MLSHAVSITVAGFNCIACHLVLSKKVSHGLYHPTFSAGLSVCPKYSNAEALRCTVEGVPSSSTISIIALPDSHPALSVTDSKMVDKSGV